MGVKTWEWGDERSRRRHQTEKLAFRLEKCGAGKSQFKRSESKTRAKNTQYIEDPGRKLSRGRKPTGAGRLQPWSELKLSAGANELAVQWSSKLDPRPWGNYRKKAVVGRSESERSESGKSGTKSGEFIGNCSRSSRSRQLRKPGQETLR